MRRSTMTALTLALALLSSLGSARSEQLCTDDAGPGGDWPMLGGDLHATNNQRAEDRIGPDTVSGLQLAWQTPAGTGFQSVPVVSGGCVYITSNGLIQALDLPSGSIVWQTAEPVPYQQWGPFALAVADGRVHVNYDNDLAPKSAAFDADTGQSLWESEPITFGYEAWQLSSPVVFNGMQLLHTTGPDFDPRARPGYALFDAATGQTLHKQMTLSEQDIEDGYAGGGVWGTPAVDVQSGYSYVGTANPYSPTKEHRYDNAVIKLDVDPSRPTFGQIVDAYKGQSDNLTEALYSQPVCRQYGGQGEPTFPPFLPSPYCAQLDIDFGIGPTMWRTDRGELMLGIMQKSGMFHVLHGDNLERAWQLQLGTNSWLTLTGGNHAPAANDGERIYVGSNPGILWALDAETGATEWAAPLAFPIYSLNVAIANGVVYALDAIGVHAWDALSGARLWEYVGRSSNLQCGTEAGGVSIAHHMLIVNCSGVVAAFRLPS